MSPACAGTGLEPAAVPGALPLPRLDRSVPRKMVPGRLGAANAAITRFLLDAKAFRDSDLPDAFDDSLRACEQALGHWIARQIGPLRCLRPTFHMQVLDSYGDAIDRSRHGKDHELPPYAAVEVSWFEAGVQEWPVGRRLEELEAACPGLGATVLHVLHRQGLRAYPLFTPAFAREVASWVYWYGEEDEETALDMQCGDDEEARQAARAEMVSRDLLDDAYPAWARTWPVRRTKNGPAPSWATIDLRRAAKTLADSRQRAIVRDVIALGRLRIADDFRCDCDGEFIGFGAVLSWSEGDLTARVFDDLMQQAHEGECCERMGEHRMALSAPASMKQWQLAMRPRFKAIALIDRLIGRLSS